MLTNFTLFRAILIENFQDMTEVTSKSSQSYQQAYRIIFLFIFMRIPKLEFTCMLQLCKPLPTSESGENVKKSMN
jgi:hypothetical protein